MKEFICDGQKYFIDSSKRVETGGDIDENLKTIFVDKGVPEKFFEGIAVHETEERKYLLKGHSYVFSHNEAQKKELEFYEKIFGQGNGLKVLEEEEEFVSKICHRYSVSRRAKTNGFKEEVSEQENSASSSVQMRLVREIIFENKHYLLDNTKRLVGTLVDVYEKGSVVYIDRDVPERFYEGLALCELITRKFLKSGASWAYSKEEGNKAEKDFYASRFGFEQAAEIFNDELKFQAWKFENESKEVKKDTGHKAIYEKGEILPR